MNPQMGAAPQGIPTFACPSCGYGVPNTMPAGIQFPCPGCQQVVTSPGGGWNAGQAAQYQAWALEHGNTAAALADAQAPQAEGRQNFSSTSNQITIVDPEVGWLSCRKQGAGRMAAPERIFAAIADQLKVP